MEATGAESTGTGAAVTTSAPADLARILATASVRFVEAAEGRIGSVLDEALEAVATHLGAVRGVMHTLDERQDRLTVECEWAHQDVEPLRLSASSLALGELPWDLAELERVPVHIDDGGPVAETFTIGQTRIGGVVALPVVVDARLGALVAFHWAGAPPADLAQSLDLLTVFATQLTLVRSRARLLERASYDELTGLANRKLMLVTLGRMLARIRRSRTLGLAVLFCDVDGVEPDGPPTERVYGARALAQLAETLDDVTRDGDLVSRFSATTFVVLCEDVSSPDDTLMIGRRLRDSMITSLADGPLEPASVTVTIGASHSSAGVAPGVLLRQADTALYRAKSDDGEPVQLATE